MNHSGLFRIIAFMGLCLTGIMASSLPSYGQGGPGKSMPSDKKEKQVFKPGNAWTLSYPLGQHQESTIDTLLYNIQRASIPSMVSDAWASTGNLGAEGINMIYFERPLPSPFFFSDALDAYKPSFAREKFYNVYTPSTFLTYDFGGNKQNHQDRLTGIFAGNVNRRIGVGAKLDYLYSKGCYTSQAVKDICWGMQAYYNGDRYEMQAFFNQFNMLNKENGGITDDLYITDPAELQGGIDKIESLSIPVNLTASHNRLTGGQFYMTHAYKVGFWQEDPNANPADTLHQEIYVPVMKFVYSMKYDGAHRHFINTNTTEDHSFWQNHYLNPLGTDDDTRYFNLSNTLGVEMIEGFQKWAKFGLSAYLQYDFRRFTQTNHYPGPELTEEEAASLTPMPEGVAIPPKYSQNRIFVGGRLEKTKGTLLRYSADAKFGLTGDAAGDLTLRGQAATRFRLARDTVEIAAHAQFLNTAPSWLMQSYISNHFIWSNDFGKTRRFKIGGELLIPWTRTRLKAGVENIQNLIYFDSESMPRQHGSNIQVFSATLEQKFNVGMLNWDNTVTYQTSSDATVLPMPKLAIYSNLYLGFTAFKVLHVQMGVDCDYYTRYTPYTYQPATMSFVLQKPGEAVEVGNYPFCNLYASAKLYQARFFVLWSHFNQGMGSKNYFSLPHYPMNPRRLMLGISVDFTD